MADLPTRTELFAVGAREMIARSEARAPAKRIAPEAIYTEGTDVNLLVAGASAMAEDVLRHHANAEADKWLDSARGAALDRLVLDRTARELTRKTAAPAYAPVTITRNAPGPAVALAAGKRVRTSTGVEFELSSTAALADGALGPLTVTARAVLAGTEGNVAIDTLTEIVDSPDQALRATNPEPATGGSDREPDGAYRERARAYYRALRRGTLGAIELGARSTPGVALTTVEEDLDAEGNPNGNVRVYVADVTGQANSVLVARVKANLLDYRCLGIAPFVYGAVPELVDVAYRLRYTAGTDPQLAFEQLRFATVALVNQTPPGKPLEVSLLYAIARRVPGLIVRDDLLVTPIGDVYPSAEGRVLRTSADRVTYVTA